MNKVLTIPSNQKTLKFSDFFVLWSDLGIGLLVLLAGTFLIPSLSFFGALLAIILGTLIGSALLAVVGIYGTKFGLPTMVLLRSTFGIRGSYLPTLLNIFQMIGWAIFEIIIISFAANSITSKFFAFDHYRLWVIIVSITIILLGIWGPIEVIKKWLKKFAFWIMMFTSIWLTYKIVSDVGIIRSWLLPGKGDLPFLQAIDLVIAMPISWIPLVSDYSRFGKRIRATFWGTFSGFSFTNIWFYTLGALMFYSGSTIQTPKEFTSTLLISAGLPALLILMVDELDNAWADIYSASVSLQNLFPSIENRIFIFFAGIVTILLALFIDITQYSNFLLIIGSLFVPLFGVFIADSFFIKKNIKSDNLYKKKGAYWYFHGVNIKAILSWIFGVAVFQLITYKMPSIGSSLPSLVISFLSYIVLSKMVNNRK